MKTIYKMNHLGKMENSENFEVNNWVHLTSPSESEIEEMSSTFHIQKRLLLKLLDRSELHRIEVSHNNVLVVSNDVFKYLEKYGFTVISLEENENLTEKTIADVRNLLRNKTINYIFLKDDEEENETIKTLKNEYGVQTVSLNSLSTLNAEDRKDKKDYVSIMMDNINSIKLEVNN